MSLLKWRIHAENKYSHLLAALLTIFVASPFIPDIDVRFPVVTFIFYLAIILTLRALELRKNIFWGLVLAGGAAFGGEVFLDVFAKISFKEGLALCSMLIYLAFTLVSIIIMLRKMFEHVRVTDDTILGGICVYLLMGFLWTIVYLIIYHLDPGSFYFSNHGKHFNFVYFSFATMTTLGYGDVYALNPFAMICATLEATFGQLYLAVFIARLVGLHIVHQVAGKSSQ